MLVQGRARRYLHAPDIVGRVRREDRVNRSAGGRGSVLILIALIASAVFAPPASAAGKPIDDRAKVIVTFDGPPGKAAERAIEKNGGKVEKKLKLVNGLAAK